MADELKRIGIIGAGAWGTSLAVTTNRAGAQEVVLWSRNKAVLNAIEEHNRNTAHLPDVYVDPAITATDNLPLVCATDVLLLVVPSQHMRKTCIAMSDYLSADVPLVICAKGIERGSLALMSEVVKDILPDNPVAVLSGPNFARESAEGKPTATTIACQDEALGRKLMFALGSSMFRPYWHDDVVGTQIGGAVKNVIAIACGIARGKGLGENAVAALITRAVHEMQQVCLVKGGRIQTLMGLSGFGDMILTCTSPTSRNMALGMALGKGKSLDELMESQGGVKEGVATAESIFQLTELHRLDMPICTAVYRVLYEEASIADTVNALMNRPFTREMHVG